MTPASETRHVHVRPIRPHVLVDVVLVARPLTDLKISFLQVVSSSDMLTPFPMACCRLQATTEAPAAKEVKDKLILCSAEKACKSNAPTVSGHAPQQLRVSLKLASVVTGPVGLWGCGGFRSPQWLCLRVRLSCGETMPLQKGEEESPPPPAPPLAPLSMRKRVDERRLLNAKGGGQRHRLFLT